MRLRDIQQRLRLHAGDLSLKLTDLSHGRAEIVGRDRSEHSLRALREIPFFSAEVDKLLEHSLFSSESSVMQMPDAQAITGAVHNFRGRAQLLRDFLDKTLSQAPHAYLGISLPVSETTTDELARYLQRLHIAIDQPVRRLGHEPLQIRVDVGSLCLEVVAAVSASLGVIGGLLGLAIARARVREQAHKTEQERLKVEQEQLRLAAEAAKVDQERLKTEQERLRLESVRLEYARDAAQKRLEIAELETTVKIAEFVRGNAEPAETSAILSAAVEELAALYSEGATFTLQIDAPEEVRSAFPSEALPATPQRELRLAP